MRLGGGRGEGGGNQRFFDIVLWLISDLLSPYARIETDGLGTESPPLSLFLSRNQFGPPFINLFWGLGDRKPPPFSAVK